MRLAQCGFVILLALPGGMVVAQQPPQQMQTDSLAAAARRARAQNKEKPKAAIVWNNDNIASAKAAPINVVGQGATANEDSSHPASGSEPADKSSAAPGRRAALEHALAAAKEQLQSLQTDLDLLQRKNNLDEQTYYGTPDYASDTDGAAQLKEEQNQIDAKQQVVADAQKKVDELQAQLDALSDNTSDTGSANDAGNTPK